MDNLTPTERSSLRYAFLEEIIKLPPKTTAGVESQQKQTCSQYNTKDVDIMSTSHQRPYFSHTLDNTIRSTIKNYISNINMKFITTTSNSIMEMITTNNKHNYNNSDVGIFLIIPSQAKT